MESDLVHHQQRGMDRHELVAGLSYSIVENYLNKVVEDRRIGRRIFYQGATASNKGIVAAFEQVVGKPITVPEHNDVTGAIGVAILAMRERTWDQSRFKGFELAQNNYQISSFECQGCPNQCEVKKVTLEGERPLFLRQPLRQIRSGHQESGHRTDSARPFSRAGSLAGRKAGRPGIPGENGAKSASPD